MAIGIGLAGKGISSGRPFPNAAPLIVLIIDPQYLN